ncbi:MAG: hypothetical protein H7248_09840 [Microbacteriaceae bacterium]|nr:hypothetical protein [Microbacteriaceae bacterium]
MLRPPKTTIVPDFLPVLSRGKHFTPRAGACFMEFASQLAGERFSDHPSCTHPAVASLARLVNDCMSDSGRGSLLVLIPSVVGLTGDTTVSTKRRVDPDAALTVSQHIELLIGVRAAASALSIASEQRQRALAAGLLRCRAEVDRTTTGLTQMQTHSLVDLIDTALADAPGATRWARQQLEALWGGSVKRMRRRAPLNFESITLLAVVSIAEACVQNADERLRLLLKAAIVDTRTLLQPTLTMAVVEADTRVKADSQYARVS